MENSIVKLSDINPNDYFTVKDMAVICNVSDQSIRNIINSIKIDFVISRGTKSGGNLYDVDALKAIQIELANRHLNQGRNSQAGKNAVKSVTVAQFNAFAKSQDDKIEKILDLVRCQCEMFNTLITKVVNTSTPQIKQDYYSILAYCNLNNLSMTSSEASLFGRRCSSLSKQKNIAIHSVPDERYGKVNSYHTSVLDEVFISMNKEVSNG